MYSWCQASILRKLNHAAVRRLSYRSARLSYPLVFELLLRFHSVNRNLGRTQPSSGVEKRESYSTCQSEHVRGHRQLTCSDGVPGLDYDHFHFAPSMFEYANKIRFAVPGLGQAPNRPAAHLLGITCFGRANPQASADHGTLDS
jgi:hypothetical protein